METINKSGVKIIKRLDVKSNGNRVYLCEFPKCHEKFEMWASHFYRGSNSCKCDNYGVTNPRLYSICVNMKTRCYNQNAAEYKNYGERGITVCDEWKDGFYNFMMWAKKNGYNDNLSIDRINNNEGYSPSNCRWATNVEQANNKRNNIIVSFANDVSLKRYCEDNGLNYKTETTFYYRHGYNALIERLKNK